MRLNDDLSEPIIVAVSEQQWVSSPAHGVDRRMLFRIGDEKARATSIVRYAPGSAFPRHIHTGGEEFVVLDGVFQDEHGDYPAGTYVRNPPGTSHVPASEAGCTIFVRLWQFRTKDRAQIVRRPGEGSQVYGRFGAHPITELFEDDREFVCLADWQAQATIAIDNPTGLEFLVLSGSILTNGRELDPQSWGRLPPGTALNAVSQADGAWVWLRLGPLMHSDVCEF